MKDQTTLLPGLVLILKRKTIFGNVRLYNSGVIFHHVAMLFMLTVYESPQSLFAYKTRINFIDFWTLNMQLAICTYVMARNGTLPAIMHLTNKVSKFLFLQKLKVCALNNQNLASYHNSAMLLQYNSIICILLNANQQLCYYS